MSTFTADNGDKVQIGSIGGNLVVIEFQDSAGAPATGRALSRGDAPALALAVLEAAGNSGCPNPAEGPTALEDAVLSLREHIGNVKAIAQANADKAALEAEALRLCLAVAGLPPKNGWPPAANKNRWIKIAKAARELHDDFADAVIWPNDEDLARRRNELANEYTNAFGYADLGIGMRAAIDRLIELELGK